MAHRASSLGTSSGTFRGASTGMSLCGAAQRRAAEHSPGHSIITIDMFSIATARRPIEVLGNVPMPRSSWVYHVYT
eukprot:2834398-Pyramimonas_sp.AAC.1